MAYWIHEADNKNNSLCRFYLCDYVTDIACLPTGSKNGKEQLNDTISSTICAPGSQCFCLEDSTVWVLGKDTDKWIKRKTSSSGGSGGIIECDIESIPISSIQSLFS